jgi:hypothetical protein
MASRIFYLLVLVALVLWAPWWLAIIFGLLGIVRYHNFYEVIIPALFFDFLYSAAGVTLVHFPLEFSVFSLAAVYLLEDFKAMIMINRLS